MRYYGPHLPTDLYYSILLKRRYSNDYEKFKGLDFVKKIYQFSIFKFLLILNT